MRRKVAIVGKTGFQHNSAELKIDCFSWPKLRDIKNIRDYDSVIINLPEKEEDRIDESSFHSKFNISIAQEMLTSGTKIIILGDPRLKIGVEGKSSENVLSWTGFQFDWDNHPGDTVIVSEYWYHEHAKKFLSSLKQWEYSLIACKLNLDLLGLVYDLGQLREHGTIFKVHQESLCWNRYRKDLASRVTLSLETKGRYGSNEVEILKGSFSLLPRTARSNDEDIAIILRDFIGIDASLPEPEWLEMYKAPGQELVEEQIQEIGLEIERQNQLLRQKEEEKEDIREPVKLLFDQGESLELAVGKVLQELGAQVRFPDNPGKEDGWLKVEVDGAIYEGVLEVKSTRNDQFGEDGLRQLLEWIHRGVEAEGKKYKGIFIGLSAREKAPNERPNPFSNNFKRTATLQGLAVIRSEDLYDLYCLAKNNCLDRDRFWSKLFEVKGVFDIQDLTAVEVEDIRTT